MKVRSRVIWSARSGKSGARSAVQNHKTCRKTSVEDCGTAVKRAYQDSRQFSQQKECWSEHQGKICTWETLIDYHHLTRSQVACYNYSKRWERRKAKDNDSWEILRMGVYPFSLPQWTPRNFGALQLSFRVWIRAIFGTWVSLRCCWTSHEKSCTCDKYFEEEKPICYFWPRQFPCPCRTSTTKTNWYIIWFTVPVLRRRISLCTHPHPEV